MRLEIGKKTIEQGFCLWQNLRIITLQCKYWSYTFEAELRLL